MVLKSDDVNYLIYRYLKESGFLHSSYIFQFESQICKNDGEMPNVEPGSLIRVLQKGLQYMDVETHLNEDGTARLCTAPFSLVGKHVCSVQPDSRSTAKASPLKNSATQRGYSLDTSSHGGHTLVHDTKEKRGSVRSVAENDDESMPMDIDVPDTEKESQQAEAVKSKRRGQIIDSVQVLKGHSASVYSCAWSPGSTSLLATGAGDGTARIWNLSSKGSESEDGIVLRHDMGDGAESQVDITSIVWNEQGTLLATASFNGQLRIWSSTGEPKQVLRQRRVPIIAMRWNRKGSCLLSAYLDGNIALWDMQTGKMRHELRAHSGCVLDVDWLDNTTFASCGNDKTIRVWRDGESQPLKTFSGHKSDINAIKWHPGGKYLASASDDGSVKIWSLADSMVHDLIGHSQQVFMVKWLPRADKAVLASASFDSTIRVWDAHSGSCLRVLDAHSKAVDSLSFSSDGRYLASGSFDRKVCIWSVKDGLLFKSYVADDAVHDVQWAPKGRVAAAIANSHVIVFDPLSA
ncbi:hypothetical protein IWW36_003495 [Coemansia brasiliensis]|uniref:Uncharacterized protein n=1 Tax=Coemansia brasiliensis TaxID=2650707 RepID=A0A9W8IDY7_9FUNG|nr:hypothetical protein IWW36_003495 [Coemansia brasiliensis]